MKNIYLIGFMGTGKSTVSCALKDLLDGKEIDIDEEIVKKEKKTIPNIFKEDGEMYFRSLETAVLKEITQQSDVIVSCGGGVVLKAENVAMMKKSGMIILLKATPQTIYERVKNDMNRPLLNQHMSPEYIAELMESRNKIYENAKDFEIVTDDKCADDIAKEIKHHMEKVK